MISRILIGTLLLFCGLLLFYQVSKNITINEIYNGFQTLNYNYVFAALIICIFATLLRGYKWNLLAGGISNTRLIFFVNMYIINIITNYILPIKLGELVTPYIINKFDSYNGTYLHRLTRLLLDRIMEAAFLLLLFLFSMCWLVINASMKYGLLLILSFIMTIATILLIYKFLPSFRALFVKQYNNIKSKIELPESVILKKICAFTLLAYLGDIYCFYFVLKAAGIDIGLFKVIIIFSISITIGVLTFIPGGVGIIELITVQLLNQFGYDNQTAIITSVYLRVVSVAFIAIFFIYLLFYALFMKRT